MNNQVVFGAQKAINSNKMKRANASLVMSNQFGCYVLVRACVYMSQQLKIYKSRGNASLFDLMSVCGQSMELFVCACVCVTA